MPGETQAADRASRILKRMAACGGLLLFGFLVGRVWGWQPWGDELVTTALVSPGGKRVALLVEIPGFIGRNFAVRIVLVGKVRGNAPTIFESPDEGRPVGTERFIWSRNGQWLVLVGRHFHVRAGTPDAGGEALYLLHDTASGSVRCNASQTKLEGFGVADLADIDFGLDFATAIAATEVDAGAGDE